MKNIWFIFIGMLAVFVLFFVMFTDWHFSSLLKNPASKQVEIQASKNIKIPNHIDTAMINNTPTSPSDTQDKPNITKESTQPNTQEETLPDDEQIYKEEITEASPEEIEVKSTQKPIIKTTPLNINGATEVKIKIKARERDGIVKAKVGITHDMLTYAQAKKKGLEANFITRIIAFVDKRVVYDASTSQFLSKNPIMKFSFSGRRGEELLIFCYDLKDNLFVESKKIR